MSIDQTITSKVDWSQSIKTIKGKRYYAVRINAEIPALPNSTNAHIAHRVLHSDFYDAVKASMQKYIKDNYS